VILAVARCFFGRRLLRAKVDYRDLDRHIGVGQVFSRLYRNRQEISRLKRCYRLDRRVVSDRMLLRAQWAAVDQHAGHERWIKAAAGDDKIIAGIDEVGLTLSTVGFCNAKMSPNGSGTIE